MGLGSGIRDTGFGKKPIQDLDPGGHNASDLDSQHCPQQRKILNFCRGTGRVLPETNSCSETWLSSDLPLLSDLLGLYSEIIHSTPCFSYQAISVFRMEGRQCSATDPNADNS